MEEYIDVDTKRMLRLFDELGLDKSMPKAERKKFLRRAVQSIRKSVQQGFRSVVPNDPRGAYKGVKILVYRDGMGANVSLHNRKKGRRSTVVRFQITRTGGVSGIRRNRYISKHTRQIQETSDRDFILRWIELGATNRFGFSRLPYGKNADRGVIRARPFFRRAVDSSREASYTYLVDEINKKIASAAIGAGASVKK